MMQSMTKKLSTQQVELSALLVDLGGVAPTEIKLVPAGSFRSARDNRPTDVPAWVMTDENAAAIVAAQAELSSRFLVDYEHQTLHAKTTGIKAPAAGWGGRFEWREGDGLYAVDMDWNQAALDAIAAKEYRYISPVFLYDKPTGHVTTVMMAALTNYPALDNLNDLAAAAALLFTIPPQETPMDKQLLALLGLPETADLAAALSAVTALKASAEQAETQIAALSAQVATATTAGAPDPAKYVPIAVVTDLSNKLAALSGGTLDMQVEKLIEDGVKDGRIIGDSMKDWLTNMGKTNVAALQGFLDNAQPIAALSGMQTQGKVPAGADPATATTEEAAKQKYQSTAALQAEFGDEATYLAYVAAENSGSVKILGGKK
jgi:phage I-like protein